MTEKVSNTLSSAMGGAKETVGRVVGSESLASSGAAQKAHAETNQSNRDAQTHAQGLGNNIKGAAQKAVGGATNDHSMEAKGHGNAALGDAQQRY